MTPRPLDTFLEQAYRRDVLFAVELLDAVTLERVGRDITVTAEGLQGKPVVNKSGFFVWLREDFARLEKLVVDPGRQPYESIERAKTDVQQPLTSIELSPRPGYSFPPGITGVLGSLIEQRTAQPRLPVSGAEVHLQWLDDLGNLHDATTISHTNESGDFVAFLRFAPTETPQLDAKGALTVRLRVLRGSDERGSADLKLPAGRIAEPSTFPQGKDLLMFAWDELQP